MTRRFKVGDLAVTVGLRGAMNNGRVVRIVAVVGPRPDVGHAFSYKVRMIDGGFALIVKRDGTITLAAGTGWVDHSNLRRLADRFAPAVSTPERVPA